METSTNEVTNPSGFVAGTLVHTRDGLIPIEQIKAGDWVLSRQENSKEGNCHSRVLKTHEYANREVYLITGEIMENGAWQSSEPIVTTYNQLFWIPQLQEDDDIYDISVWASVNDLWNLLYFHMVFPYPMFELQDGRIAQCGFREPILRTSRPDIGLLFSDPQSFKEFSDGPIVDFSIGCPRFHYDERGRFVDIELDIERDEVFCDEGDDSIYYRTCGCQPILRRIYNIDVENTHAYFVDAMGILVHDGTHAHNTNFQIPPSLDRDFSQFSRA